MENSKKKRNTEEFAEVKGWYFLELFASTEANPEFVTDESCHYIGALDMELEKKENGGVFVKINVSGTELEVQATVKPSGRVVSTRCSFLG